MNGLISSFDQFLDLVNLILLAAILIYVQQIRNYWVLPAEQSDSGMDAERYPYSVTNLLGLGFVILFANTACGIFLSAYPHNLSLLIEVSALVFITRGFMEYSYRIQKNSVHLDIHTFEILPQNKYLALHLGVFLIVLGVCLMGLKSPDASGLWSMVLLKVWGVGTLVFALLEIQKRNIWMQTNVALILLFWGVGILMQPLPNYKKAFLLTVCFLVLRFLYNDLIFRLNRLEQRGETVFRDKRVMLSFLLKLSTSDKERDGVCDAGSQNYREVEMGSFDPQLVLKQTLNFIMEQSGASAGGILLLEDKPPLANLSEGELPSHLVPKVLKGPFPPLKQISQKYSAVKQKYLNEVIMTQRVESGEGLIGKVFEKGEPLLVSFAQNDLSVTQPFIDYLTIETMMAVPLKILNKSLGILILYNKKEDGQDFPFTSIDLQLVAAVADQSAIALSNARLHQDLAEKERFEREMSMAQEVQKRLLPDKCPEIPGYELGAFNRAAWRIGGDYYDFIWKSPSELVIVIADVSGKGVPGALTMAMVRSTIKEQVKVSSGLTDLICRMNQFIYQDTKADQFVSMSLGLLDLNDNTLTLVRAGHEPLIRFPRDGKVHELFEPMGIALGIDPGDLFRESLEEKKIFLIEGDTLIFYTDGITEAMNASHEEFTLERFVQVVSRVKEKTSKEILETIQKQVSDFTGDIPQHDDLTLVLLQVKNLPIESTVVEKTA